MKLLFYAGGFAPVGGVEAFIRDLSDALAAEGHAVSLLCWGPDSALVAADARGLEVRRQNFRWGCRLYAPDLLLAIRQGLRQTRCHDLVLFTKIPPLPILWMLRNLIGPTRPLFVYVTPYRPREMWQARDLGWMLNMIDAIIVQAAPFVEDLRACGFRGIVEIIPYIPPAPVTAIDLPACDGALRLGFLGRLVPQKNLHYLLQVFSRLGTDPCSDPRPWELHLFGDGSERAELERLADELGLRDRTFFHGGIPREAVPSAIDRCHLFAFSSVSEGQCLAALEILSRGRPVVATPVGAFPEILAAPELGAIAPLDDADRFARILGELGTRLANGRLTPRATQSRFTRLLCRDAVVQRYCTFLSGLAAGHFPLAGR